MSPLDTAARWLSVVLSQLTAITGNPGIAIILIAAGLQALLYVPVRRGSRTRELMQKLQPVLQELKKKHADDQQRLQAEVLALWQRNDINPFGGCLPMLVWGGVVAAMWRVFGLDLLLWQDAHFLWMAPGSLHDRYPTFFADSLAGFDGCLLIAACVLCGLGFLKTRSPETRLVMSLFLFALLDKWPAGLVLYWGTFAFLQIILHPRREPEQLVLEEPKD